MRLLRKIMAQWWWFIWGLSLLVCLCLWGYFAFSMHDLRIINIEFGFYLSILGLAAINMMKMCHGKYVIYGLILLYVYNISSLPEFQQIETIRICIENNHCEEAIQKELIAPEFEKQKKIEK